MIKTVTLEQLEGVLGTLGFVQHTVPTSHVYFDHPRSKALLMLPLLAPRELVPYINLAAARAMVDNFGIADREKFERLLAESATQTTAAAA